MRETRYAIENIDGGDLTIPGWAFEFSNGSEYLQYMEVHYNGSEMGPWQATLKPGVEMAEVRHGRKLVARVFRKEKGDTQ